MFVECKHYCVDCMADWVHFPPEVDKCADTYKEDRCNFHSKLSSNVRSSEKEPCEHQCNKCQQEWKHYVATKRDRCYDEDASGVQWMDCPACNEASDRDLVNV